jgi:hypothetical protein
MQQPSSRHGTCVLAAGDGQTMPLVALMLLVLFGFAGLAMDAGHLYLVHRTAQNAVDAGALAAGKFLSGGQWTGPPLGSSDASVKAAHDWTANNGFSTTFSSACDTSTANTPTTGLTQFKTSWYDTGACGSTSFTTRVDVYSPPQALVGDCVSTPYNCLQVVVTRTVQNYLMGLLGQPTSTISTSASVFSEPAASVLSVPLPYAVYLYQPGPTTCGPLVQDCFDGTKVPQRSQMSCKGTNNCPAFWAQPGTSPLIVGINGSIRSPATDTVALQSNGSMILQASTTICDPFGGATCTAGAATGALGFALNAAGTGAKLYCSGFGGTPPGSPGTNPPCTTPAPSGAVLAPMVANETGFASQTWTPTINTSGLPYCAGLLLNGQKIDGTAFVGVPNSKCVSATLTPNTPYTVQPGQYDFIVINHGQYDFEAGLYLVTGTGPQNTALAGSLANGIDHSQELAAFDWDLCPGVVGCTLTAGVWVGHGSAVPGSFVAGNAGSSDVCPTGGVLPGQLGGGDPTRITGNGVTFVLQGATSGGFVSTHEVDFIGLVPPGLGQARRTSGVPILIDLENDTFIHLDADGDDTSSRFQGIIYQTINAKGGGVEMNPGLGGGSAAAIGQVLAYSLTTFGTSGWAVDFQQGLGGATVPVLSTAKEAEPEILTSATLVNPGIAGQERIVVQYNDEWKLDAYNAYVKINNGSPIYFSEGIWNPVPPAGQPLPPATNNPGDSSPALPGPDPMGRYTKTTDALGKPDWTVTHTDSVTGATSTFRINGDWAWGHEQSIPGATSVTNAATLTYTFPIPAGTAVTITLFMEDGDSCGDYATATFTFNNVGAPSATKQAAGAVHLVQ